MDKKGLMSNIRNCRKCNSGVYTPFFFPMKDQEVMIISAVPSMQAMYKPLTSIRFFRRLCLALFGDKYLREKEQCDNYLREFCGGNIYWTHYYKCFAPDLKDFFQVSDICAASYLKDEINALQPKQIIVFGDGIREKVRALAGDKEQICLFKPFPATGAEQTFDEVREKIKPYLKFVKKAGFANKARYSTPESALQGNEVHLRFESDAFEKMFSEHRLDTPTESIEEIWHKNLVVPNMKRYIKLVSAYSFIENQIQVFLLDYMARTELYTIFKELRGAHQNPSWATVFKAIKDRPVNKLMRDFMEYKPSKLGRCREKQFLNGLNTLRLIRNQIVHEGGFIHAQKYSLKGQLKDNCLYHTSNIQPFPGIFIFANTIYIAQEGEKSILQFVKDLVDLLCELQ